MHKFGRNYFYGRRESNYSNYDKLNPSRQFKTIIKFMENLNGRFLDVGCAFGFLLKEAASFFDKVYGCDVSGFAIQKARKNVPCADLRVADIQKSLPYPDRFFDCITALDVLEHTESLEKSFGNIVRKLKPGGYIIISIPINEWPRKLFGFLDKDKTHISVLKDKEITRIISKHGLTVISKRYFCPAPFFYKIPGIPAETEMILKK